METLNNKIDFAVILSVKNANPNGDPLNGNRPRVNYDGYGEISDVCIKRKIRNRLMENRNLVFVQSDDNKIDDCKSLRERAEKELKDVGFKDEKKFAEAACQKWIDVRSFGQVFAFSDKSKKNKKTDADAEQGEKEGSVSIGIRGPVSIHPAFSIAPISTTSIQITKSVSGEGEKKASDTMGMKHRVDYGLYRFNGSINPQLASKTGFSNGDAEAIKQALVHLFDNDASSARPEGSMEVLRVYWWKHNCRNGQYSSAKVHRTLMIDPQAGTSDSIDILDYIQLNNLDGLTPEVIDGE